MGKLLGLDFGLKRVGVAITNLEDGIVFPRESVAYKSDSELMEQVRCLCEEENIGELIVGNPLHLDGTQSLMGKRVEEFAEKCREMLKIPVILSDERLSSEQAIKGIHVVQGTKKGSLRRCDVDSTAACIILETYLKGIKRFDS